MIDCGCCCDVSYVGGVLWCLQLVRGDVVSVMGVICVVCVCGCCCCDFG